MCICYVYCCSSYTRPCHRARSALRNVFSTKGCTRCIGCGGRGRGALGSAARRPLRRCRRRGSDSGEVGVTGPAAALTCSAVLPGAPSSLTKAKCDGSRRRAMPRVTPGVLRAVHGSVAGCACGCFRAFGGSGMCATWRACTCVEGCLLVDPCVCASGPGRERFSGVGMLAVQCSWNMCCGCGAGMLCVGIV